MRFVVVFLLFFLVFSSVANAFFPIVLRVGAVAARNYAPSFFARSVVSMNAGLATIRGVGSKVLTLDTRALGWSVVAGSLGFADSSSVGLVCSVWSSSMFGQGSSLSSYQSQFDSYYSGFNYFSTSGWSIDSGLTFSNGGRSVWFNHYSQVSPLTGSGNGVVSCLSESTGSIVVPAVDSLNSVIVNSPTQSLTDGIVGALASLSVTDPAYYDLIVSLRDVPSPTSSLVFGSSSQVDNAYITSLGQIIMNGATAGSASYVGNDGLTHLMTLDANGNLLVDGLYSTGSTVSNPYAGSSSVVAGSSTVTNTFDVSGNVTGSTTVTRSKVLPDFVTGVSGTDSVSTVVKDAAGNVIGSTTETTSIPTDTSQADSQLSAKGIPLAVGNVLGGVVGGSVAPEIVLHGPDGSVIFQSNLSGEVDSTGVPALMVTLMGFMGVMAGLFFSLREILS